MNRAFVWMWNFGEDVRFSLRQFQRVLDEARHQMARYYLSNSVLELNEAAYLLGFVDPNSFGRAFRAWEGVPPSDWRETHRASSVS